MGHAIILDKMRQVGRALGKELLADPMRGYLANLDLDDYKQYFRPCLPETIKGLEFLENYGPTADTVTTVHPDHEYAVQSATDHHVLEARRIRNFVDFIEQAAALAPDHPGRTPLLDKAGHLMYASHSSYTNDAQLGAPECDLLVDMVRRREPDGFYGARITGGGCATIAGRPPGPPRPSPAPARALHTWARFFLRRPRAILKTAAFATMHASPA
jgi:galactokinase